jgi:hypothetical protein
MIDLATDDARRTTQLDQANHDKRIVFNLLKGGTGGNIWFGGRVNWSKKSG